MTIQVQPPSSARTTGRAGLAATLALSAALAAPVLANPPAARATELATAVAAPRQGAGQVSFDGVVQAVRQTTLAAQVAGAIVELPVRVGDAVKAGQVLVRLDARTAQQTATAGGAQAQAARAAQDAATREYERQKQLYEKRYISQAALDRAEAQFKASTAEARAQLANADAARTQSDLFVVRAPYAGIVSELPVVLGDMAMPGKPLVTVYDPAALRISAALPQTVAARLPADVAPAAEVPDAGTARLAPLRVQLLPAVDPATHTRELRLDLRGPQPALAPGMFARVWLPVTGGEATGQVWVPARAVVRRAELVGVYVVNAEGKPLLRQVRLGRAEGDRIEVISGLSGNERVALDPQAAALVR